jgi:hypothetical protein
MASEPAGTRRTAARSRRKRIGLAVGAGLATFVILVVLDGIWAGRALVRNLTASRAELSIAIESVVTGDAEAAGPHFEAALLAADQARRAVGHPSFGLAGLLPVIGDNVDAAAAVAGASRDTAIAGRSMVRVARDLRWTDVAIPATAAAGRLDLEALTTAASPMNDVVEGLRAALTRLEAAGGGRLLGPVSTGYRDAMDGLARRADLAARFRDTIRLLPVMFGGEEPRRYLLCVSSLGLPRPGGGTPAAVTVLTATNGVLTMDPFAPAPDSLAEAPPSPDWPTTAGARGATARATHLRRLDGVIMLDAVSLQDLVWVSGDVPVRGRRLALSDRTTAQALEIDAFLGNDADRTAERYSSWATDILYSFLSVRPSLESFALASTADARNRHLEVYLARPAEQRLVRSLGLDGRARLGDRNALPVATTWASTGTSHVGALVDTTVRFQVRVREDGSAAVEAEVVFDNRAGTDPPSILLGRPSSGLPVGTFAADVTLYVPPDAKRVVAETSRPSPIRIGEGLRHTTVTGSIEVGGRTSTTFTVSYVVDDVATPVEGWNELTIRCLPQPTIEGTAYQVQIRVPDGSRIGSTSPELRLRGTSASFSGTLSGPVDLELRYR